MRVVADARHLPFRDGAFDSIVTAPVWDHPKVLNQAMAEMARVVTGRMVIMLRNETQLRDGNGKIVRRLPALPQSRGGFHYYHTPPAGAAALLSPTERVLDCFAGIGGVCEGARMIGAFAVGSDLDEDALAFSRDCW